MGGSNSVLRDRTTIRSLRELENDAFARTVTQLHPLAHSHASAFGVSPAI